MLLAKGVPYGTSSVVVVMTVNYMKATRSIITQLTLQSGRFSALIALVLFKNLFLHFQNGPAVASLGVLRKVGICDCCKCSHKTI